MGCCVSEPTASDLDAQTLKTSNRKVNKHHGNREIDGMPRKKVNVPIFIQLFIIRRIVAELYFCKDIVINDLMVEMKSKNNHEKEMAEQILDKLLTDDIKLYMSEWYNEKQQMKVIEMTFVQIIKKFGNEYRNMMRYSPYLDEDDVDAYDEKSDEIDCKQKSINDNYNNIKDDVANNKKYFYQTILFNMNDVMSLIFEFLTFDAIYEGDLYNCSLVDSHWLYQVYNPNSIYYVELTELIIKTHKIGVNKYHYKHDGRAEYITRMWQRISKAKAIELDFDKYKYNSNIINNYNTNKLLLANLSLITNVKQIICNIEMKHTAIFKMIVDQSTDSIKHILVSLDRRGTVRNTAAGLPLFPMELINTETIHLCFTYFYLKWSHRLNTLILSGLINMDCRWFEYIDNNCDCSGIKALWLGNVSFLCESNNNKKLNIHNNKNKNEAIPTHLESRILIKFARKLENLNHLNLSVHKVYSDVFELWRLLAPTIEKNNGYVGIKITTPGRKNIGEVYRVLLKFIQEKKARISKLEIHTRGMYKEHREDVQLIILNANIEWLILRNWAKNEDTMHAIVELLKRRSNNSSINNSNYDYTYDYNCAVQNELKKTKGELDIKWNDNSLMLPKLLVHDLFSSLSKIELRFDSTIKVPCANVPVETINEFLDLVYAAKQNVFVVMLINTSYIGGQTEKQLFNQCFKRIWSLMIVKQNPIDITMNIDATLTRNVQFDDIVGVYLEHFDESRLHIEYKKPKYNKYCQPLEIPDVSCDCGKAKFCASNAESINYPLLSSKVKLDYW